MIRKRNRSSFRVFWTMGWNSHIKITLEPIWVEWWTLVLTKDIE